MFSRRSSRSGSHHSPRHASRRSGQGFRHGRKHTIVGFSNRSGQLGSALSERLAALRAGRLAGARELRLGGLGLTEMPDEVFGLAETLEVLDLGHNALTRLPDDLGRLRRLKVLFASGNPFDRLPPVLGDCPALGQVGFRGCGLREIPAEALPRGLRWLTVTDNKLEAVPPALAERPALQKLMLAGNRLRHLPDALRDAPNLELIRISANRFDALPSWLSSMPRLAWLAWSGNPLDAELDAPAPRAVPWAELRLGALLGQGASGRVHAAGWRRTGAEPQDVAVKLFKGTMTSDGLPGREMAACLAAGAHPNVAGAIGRVADHPDGLDALVMPLLPSHWRILANPPSLASCSRDVYEDGFNLPLGAALRIAGGIARAGAHLHGRGLLHGDLYAHNILWDGETGDAVLSDFGAASFMPPGAARRLEPLDVLAFGLLLGELLARCEAGDGSAYALQRACVAPDPAARPHLAEVADALPI